MQLYARPGQLLAQHLENVGRLAAEFSAEFGAAEWGRFLGHWHDCGKAQPDFQRYMLENSG